MNYTEVSPVGKLIETKTTLSASLGTDILLLIIRKNFNKENLPVLIILIAQIQLTSFKWILIEFVVFLRQTFFSPWIFKYHIKIKDLSSVLIFNRKGM